MPAKYQLGEEHRKGSIMINGLRPSPLMINNQSKPIKKQPPPAAEQHRRRQEGPVIIYTESPKIIHTKPHEFMALVQRLTGHRENAERRQVSVAGGDESEDEEGSGASPTAAEEEENGPNEFLADFPLFTPTSNNLFLSPAAQQPHPLHRYGDFLSLSPSVGKMESSSSSSSSIFNVKREFIDVMK
ncbi:VQ motif-containing protein 8, chloroplastic-like [Impatiens glandulifera]|uniref:VQ motif-containing protein 8, chloroplastic-like n=1 Tax=Impatiens glandulifera TaxID=253017 RepID=UPI001FB05024|nr:VQ motif-containing protein 8, chloroplastic-like [Impatiens glandulifera]